MSRSPKPRNRAGESLFTIGELLPRTAVRDETGVPTDLLAALEGSPSVLLHLAQPADSNALQAAHHLAELEIAAPRLTRAILVPAGTRGAQVIALADLGLKVYVSQNPKGGADNGEPMRYATTDTAGRVLETAPLRAGEIRQLDAHLAAALTAGTKTTGRSLSHAAPVLMIPNVLAPAQCKRLVAYFEKSESHPSGVLDLSGPEPQWRPDPAVKSRQDLRLEDPGLTRELEQAVAARVLPEIRKCFYYVVTHHEPFKLVRYDADNGYFRPHRDNESADTRYRRFAMTLNLNADDYEGGALKFPEFSPATYRPPTGGAIVFSCSLLHEATDVTRGSRYVALGFFYNPADGLTSKVD